MLPRQRQLLQRPQPAAVRVSTRANASRSAASRVPTDPQAALATITYRLVSTAQQATLSISIPVAS